jgi:hypothetical protein
LQIEWDTDMASIHKYTCHYVVRCGRSFQLLDAVTEMATDGDAAAAGRVRGLLEAVISRTAEFEAAIASCLASFA